MINAEFIAQCSDEQINKGVAWLQAGGDFNFWTDPETGTIYKHLEGGSYVQRFDPCSNPNDIMPIAIANDIEFVRRKGIGDRREFIASKNLINSVNKNPYRAICEVYILMSVNK